MINISPLNVYKQTGINTADRGQLVLIVYENIIKNLNNGKAELEKEKPKFDAVNNYLNKSQDFITELMAALDFETGGDLSKNLFSLYDFLGREIMHANFTKDFKILIPVIEMFTSLNEAWIQVVKKSNIQGESNVNQGLSIGG